MGRILGCSPDLFTSLIRFSSPDGQVAIPWSLPEISPEGVVFRQATSSLSISSGRVVWEYSPTGVSAAPAEQEAAASLFPAASAGGTQADRPGRTESKEKAKAERYVGELGEVKTHTTKSGKFVAEVELATPDPDRPGQKLFLKFATFDEMARELKANFPPGVHVSAVGVPHELKRSSHGRHWTERQLYLVRLPRVVGPEE